MEVSVSGLFLEEIKDGIVFVKINEKEELTADEAQEGFDLTMKLTNNTPALLLCDYSNLKSQTKECRNYYASREVAKMTKACAIISSSVFGRMLANFYMGLNKPQTPTRFFTDKNEAILWLNTYK